jgi:hypothetical protein
VLARGHAQLALKVYRSRDERSFKNDAAIAKTASSTDDARRAFAPAFSERDIRWRFRLQS